MYTKEVERRATWRLSKALWQFLAERQGGGPACSEYEEQMAWEGALGVGGVCQARPSGDQARSSREVDPTALGTRERGGGRVEGRPDLSDWISQGQVPGVPSGRGP